LVVLAFWVAAAVVVLLYFIGAQMGRFVPFPAASVIALTFAIPVSFFTGYVASRPALIARVEEQFPNLPQLSPSLQIPAVRFAIISIGTFLLSYGAAERGGGEIWTLAMGRPGATVLHLTSYNPARRSVCAGVDFQEAAFTVGRGFCVNLGPSFHVRPGTPITLTGRISSLGILVDRYRIGAVQ
jgi:hypothetical protein